MKVEYYHSLLRTLYALAQTVHLFDIPKLIEDINKAEAICPLVDPTLWSKNHEAMAQDKKLLEAALPLWQFFDTNLKLVNKVVVGVGVAN